MMGLSTKKIVGSVLLLLFQTLGLLAQDFPVEISVTLPPPYPTNIDAYVDYLEDGIFEVTNVENSQIEAYFKLSIQETSGILSISSDPSINPPVFLSPGITIFTGGLVTDLFGDLTLDDVNTAGLTQEEIDAILISGQMPEGEYRLCITAFDQQGMPLSDEMMGCTTFDVYFGERPIIESPWDGENLLEGVPFLFSWSHIVNDPMVASRLEYTLKILDLTENNISNIPLAMIDPSVPTIYEENLGSNFQVSLIPQADVFYESGHDYAVRVQVQDPDGILSFGSDTYSEIVLFSYDKEEGGDGTEIIVAAPEITSEDESFVFDEDNAVEIEWEHDYDSSNGFISYEAYLVDLTELDVEEINADEIASMDEHAWSSDAFQSVIILDGDEVDWEYDHTYAMVIKAESDNALDNMSSGGYSEVYTFEVTEPESEAGESVPLPEITAPLSSPITTIDIDQITLRWEHELDTIANPDLVDYDLYTSYTLQIIDLTDQKIPSPDVEDFMSPLVRKVKNEAILKTAQTKIIKPAVATPPATPKALFLPGHTYAITVKAVVTAPDTVDVDEYENEGYSNIVVFSREAAPIPIDTTPMPIITAPLHRTTLNDTFIEVTWQHDINSQYHAEWIGATTYRAQVIDLTTRNITDPVPTDFSSGEAKIWNDTLSPIEIQTHKITISPSDQDSLVSGRRYAVAIRAITPADDTLQYPNLGYSNIVTWTYSDSLPLPYIITPEDKLITKTSPMNIIWDHGLDSVKNKTIVDNTSYRLRIIDLTATKAKATVTDFEDEVKYDHVYNQLITTKELQLPDSTGFPLKPAFSYIIGHKYGVAIKAFSTNSNIKYPNSGYGDIITFTHDEPNSDGCPKSDCESAIPTIKTSMALSDTIITRDTFLMGDIRFVIKTITDGDADEGYSGTGEMILGFIGAGAKVKVAFEGVQVNSSKQVFAGSAEALYDTQFGDIDALVGFAGSAITKMDHEAANTMSSALRSAGKLASALSGATAISLPLGFDKVEGNDTTIVGITKMSFTPRKNTLMAIMSLKNPDWGKFVPAFGADKVCFKNDGFAKQVKLFLADDYVIETEIGDLILEATDPDDSSVLGTYIELNCNGFKEAQITASLALNREYLLPVDDEGDVIEDEDAKAKITLSGTIQKQSNFLLAANVSPCEIPGLEGFSVTIKNGYFDGSDKSNPPNIKFPNGYTPSEAGKLWRGFWFQEFSITAPRDWAGGSMEDRTKIGMYNFILDETGISVVGKADNLLAIDKGAYEGFAISLDELSVEIVRNQFKNVSINGRMGLPILPEDKFLSYEGFIEKLDTTTIPAPPAGQKQIVAEMALTVTAPDAEYYIPSLKSTLRLDETTQISIKRDRTEQGVVALLEGSLAIGGIDDTEDAASMEFPRIQMTGMGFNTLKPHPTATPANPPANPPGKRKFFTPPVFGFSRADTTQQAAPPANPPTSPPVAQPAAEPKVNGFSIGLTEVKIEMGENGDATAEEVGDGTPVSLTIGGQVHIVRSSTAGADKGFELSAEASITLGAEVNKVDEKFTFAFKSVDAAELAIESQMGPLGIKGAVAFYSNDVEFGTGVVGDLTVTAPMLQVGIEGRFGNVTNDANENFSYFYLFGQVDVQAGIVLGATGISLHRFLGGAYANMNVRAGSEMWTDPRKKYTPDNGIAFGLRAGLGFSFTKPELIFAQMAIEFSITKSGGLGHISLEGQIDMFQTEPFADKSGTDFEGLRLKGVLTVRAPENEPLELSGGLLVLANLAAGVVVGDQSGPDAEPYQVVHGTLNLKGDYFATQLGTYQNPGAVKIGIPNVGTNGVEASAGIKAKFYIQAAIGTPADGQTPMTFVEAPVPEFIQRLLDQGSGQAFRPGGGDPTVIYPKQYGDAFKAIAGLQVQYNLNVTFAIFYADFKALLGFDASILPNEGIVCTNHDNTGLGFGPDQHYMKAQVYAGLEGGAGLDIDIGFYKGKIEIVYVYAAMLLQGGFPNPVYASGEAALGFSLLGGLIAGDLHFKVEVGEKCEEELFDPMGGITFIEGIDPDEGREGVSPFVKPLLSFQRKMGEYSFTKPNADPNNPGPGDMAYFNVALERFEVTDQSNSPLNFEMVKADDGLSAYIKVTSLEPHTTYNLVAEVKVKELKSGSWVTVSTENKVVTFTTGKMPDYVVWENVQDCYPFRDEEYFMIDHNVNSQGLIKLLASQAEIFEPFTPAGQQWHSKVVGEIYQNTPYYWSAIGPNGRTSGSGLRMAKVTTGDVAYYEDSNILVYDFPSEELATAKNCEVKIRRVWYQNPNYDLSSVDLSDETASVGDDARSFISYTREGKSYANATEERPLDKTLCFYNFKTSSYTNITEKLTSNGPPTLGFETPWFLWSYKYKYSFNGNEPFSEQEIGSRVIPESYTVNKNTLFVEEYFKNLPSGNYTRSYYGTQFALRHPHKMSNIELFEQFNFGVYDWYNGKFNIRDPQARRLYAYANTSVTSTLFTKWPTDQDLKNLDLGMARAGSQTTRRAVFGTGIFGGINHARKYFTNFDATSTKAEIKMKYTIPALETFNGASFLKDKVADTFEYSFNKPIR